MNSQSHASQGLITVFARRALNASSLPPSKPRLVSLGGTEGLSDGRRRQPISRKNTIRFPVFVAPPNGNHPRPPGYVPGRVAPVRSPHPAKAPPPPPMKPLGPPPERRATFNLSEENQRRERDQNLQKKKNSLICFGVSIGAFFLTLILVLSLSSGDILDGQYSNVMFFFFLCLYVTNGLLNLTKLSGPRPVPQQLEPRPPIREGVIVRSGHLFRLESSATFHSITIQSGGKVVFADNADGSKNITLRTRHILIEDGGALHIGAPKCRYRSRATVALVGRSDDKAVAAVPGMGRKFIGLMGGGTLELHGAERVSWSLLTRSVPASGLNTGGYSFLRNFSRGINLRVVDQDTAAVLLCERYDTHDSRNDSRRLTQLLRTLPEGRIVTLAVGDSAAWALVSVVGGGNASCAEDVKEHENHNTGGRALARRNFTTVDGVDFSVTAYSEWKTGFPITGFQVDAVDQVLLNLQDEVQQTWQPGDQIVVASTDYSMHQAEEFTLLPCSHCSSRQVRIQGKPLYNHVGEILDGVDMRAEVGLLSRNILIYGEMESSCYGNNACQFFSHDTYGGHIKILGNFSSVHLSHVELKNMGQQGEIGSYPLHFHMCGDVDQKGGYREPTYVDGLSIHHSFSRCVTIHATNGLLVKDTVGYDTLGHCFFLEDGIEQRNTFFHNLGLLTRPGTLLPTDRNETMCTSIKDKVYKGYTPSPSTECKAVSTFWIANPNNNLISNAAAGSQLFHRRLSWAGTRDQGRAHTLGIFYNNRVHSNFKAGLFIDKGVKTSNASAADPREYLCLDNSARFRPHQDADPTRPRVAAVIDTLISYKNNDLGAWIRGGDIVIQDSGFADNGVGLAFASDGSYPKDEGSSQEVTRSLFVGESRNRGTNGGQNKYWGLGGIYDGPVRLTHSTFRGYIPTPERYTSAVGFNLKNTWQLTPRNNLSQLSFHPTVGLQTFFGRPGQWFEENDLDGDKNSIFHDVDGSVTGYTDTYAGRADNYLIQHPDCVNMPQWSGVICSGRYSQVYIQTQGSPNLILSISRDEYPAAPLVLRGINSQGALSQQYQPILMMSKSYSLHWSGPAPREVVLSLINFDKDDWALVGLCYPSDTTFQIMADINDRQSNTFDDLTDYGTVSSLAELENRPMERKYYFDRTVGLLWFYLRARHGREGHSYCSAKGCERVKVMATTSSKQTCNCTAKAYPKYSKTPSVVVHMPEPWTFYLQTQVKSLSSKEQQKGDNSSYITVNEVTMPFSQPGYFLVSVDACSGKVTKKTSFAKMDAKMEQYLKTGIPKRSIVLMATRGQPEGLGGSPPPPWVWLQAGQGDEVLGLQERYLPLGLEAHGCTPPAAQTRRDLELLKKPRDNNDQ
ncbi:hypothetical protein F7725_012503, partial [Dissostichus mawsoni]